MLNDRRRLWTSIIFIGLFAPFMVLVVMNYLTGRGRAAPGSASAAALSAAVPGNAPATSAIPATGAGAPAASTPAAVVEDYPLLAAGDGHELWIVQPVEGENKERGFALLRRSANTGAWVPSHRVSASGGSVPYWTTPTMPRALAIMQTPADHPGASTPYVFGNPKSAVPGGTDPVGWVTSYTLDGDLSKDPLPRGHTIKAAVGAVDQLFVVTLGPPVPGATQPGEPLRVSRMAAPLAAPPLASAPALAAGSASAPATSAPAAASEPVATAPAVPLLFNVYWYPPTSPTTRPASMPVDALTPPRGEWCLLAPLGAPAEDSASLPKSSSQLALLEQDERLNIFWADPVHPREIMVRSLNYEQKGQQWSSPRAVQLEEEFPSGTGLFAIMLDQTIYLLWTVPTGSSPALHGGWVDMRGSGDPMFHPIAAMSLEGAGTEVHAGDVAVGPSENSIVALISTNDELKEMVFDSRGRPLSKAKTVAVESPGHDVQVGQNVAMVLLALLLVLGLWQWRQKPLPLALPAGMAVAPLHLRALAFGIDAVLPYAAVLLITHNMANGYFWLLRSWVGMVSNPEEMLKSPELLMFLGIYLGHVAIGELIFRRSLGKSLVGLQVMTLDGKTPTLGSIAVRNLVRLPECLAGVVVVYLVISERRQRLGDLLAKTVVVAPESAESVDAEKKTDAGKKKE